MSKKGNIKVIYIGTYNTSEILSGPEKVSKRIFEEYSKTEKTLFIHYFQDGEKYGYFKKLFGYEKTAEVNGSEVLRLGIFRMLYNIIQLKPKTIHILCFDRFVIFLYLLKIFFHVNIFYTVNGIIRHENKYYNKEPVFNVIKNIIVENVLIYYSDRIFYLSKYSKYILSLYFSFDKAKLSKVKNGLDDCFLGHKYLDYSIKEHNSLVFIGDIGRKEKGFFFLINSLTLLDDYLKLYIIGKNSKNLQIPNINNLKTIFLDKMSPNEMIVFLKDKRFIISSSEYDPFNISVLEAISCGLYPIFTKQTGLSEIIEDYCSVSFIDYGDNYSFARTIKYLLKQKIQLKYINNLDDLSWSNIFKKYYTRYYD